MLFSIGICNGHPQFNEFHSLCHCPADYKDNLLANFNVLLSSNSPDSVLLIAMKSAIDNLQSPPPIDPGMVFTDDRSPIEWLTNKMVVSFVLSDQMESLK